MSMNPPDRLEIGLRFGCGGLLGLVVGLYGMFRFWRARDADAAWFWGIIAVTVVVCGGLAVRYGDRFFEKVSDLLTWPRQR